jgi:hypothetical protein
MRVAVFVAFVLVASTPSEASTDCMSKAEARQHLGSVHIYWHGRERCWDANPGRRRHHARKLHRVQETRTAQKKIDPPKWHESMSQMLPDEEPATPAWADRWADRWVEFAPPRVPVVAADTTGSLPDITGSVPDIIEPNPEPILTPRVVLMAVLAIVLTLVLVELMFGSLRWSGRRYQN